MSQFSAIETIAKKGDEVLCHFVFLPHDQAQKRMALASGYLNAFFYPDSFYQLTANPPQKLNEFVTGRYSLAHMTVMHFWAKPDAAQEIFNNFMHAAHDMVVPKTVTIGSLKMFASLPHFLGQPGENDAVAWIDAERTDALVALQKLFYDKVVEQGGTPITKLGDQWQPHFTLAAEQIDPISKTKPSLEAKIDKDQNKKLASGEFFLGVSGPNGQFRGVTARLGVHGKLVHTP